MTYNRNVRRDHEQRIKALEEVQEIKEDHAEYIQYNREIVDQAILIVRYNQYFLICKETPNFKIEQQ